MGQILHESGCTREIANTMLRLCGREKSALALNLTGYIISIPVFFDAAFVILIGLIREMAREGKLALNTLVTALVVGLTCTHALVIPKMCIRDRCGGFPLSQKATPGTFPLTFRHGYQETNPFFSLSFSSTIRWLNPVMWTSEQDT